MKPKCETEHINFMLDELKNKNITNMQQLRELFNNLNFVQIRYSNYRDVKFKKITLDDAKELYPFSNEIDNKILNYGPWTFGFNNVNHSLRNKPVIKLDPRCVLFAEYATFDDLMLAINLGGEHVRKNILKMDYPLVSEHDMNKIKYM